MKLATFEKNGKVSCGIVADSRLLPLEKVWTKGDCPSDITGLIMLGIEGLAELSKQTRSAVAEERICSVKFLAPIPRPGKVLAMAGNYSEHIKEAGLKLGLSDSPRLTTVPRLFLMPSTAVTGPDSVIPWPVYSRQIDYEVELAAIVGCTARDVSPDNALEYVAGYTIVNDISARSVTFAADRAARPWDRFYDWLAGKWADGFLPMGPYMVTADEIDNVQDLEITLKVNGQVRQQASTSEMIFPVAETVSFISHIVTLEPGDIIATGTPSGVGMATGKFLQAGDRIECTIEKLGTLVNTMGSPPDAFYQPLSQPASGGPAQSRRRRDCETDL